MKKINNKHTNPRYVTFLILRKDHIFSQKNLADYFFSFSLSDLNKSLVTQLVNGINRDKLFLEWCIKKHSTRPLNKIDNDVKILLLIGSYQLLRMDKIPAYASINETVEIGKMFLRKKHLVSFINAILRSIDRNKQVLLKGPTGDNSEKNISIFYSHPDWLVERWISFWGERFTKDLCFFNNQVPDVTIRVNSLKISLEELKGLLSDSNIDFEPLKYLSDGLRISTKLRLEEHILYKKGFFSIQSESAMFPARVLAPKRGDKILDLCAAPGNKTTQLAEMMKNSGNIVALDISSQRLNFLKKNCERLGVTNVKIISQDLLEMGSKYEKGFSRVLLDAPCSGTGVLSRRSDLRWQKKPDDIERISSLQEKLLHKASTFVKSSGVLVYSVCSIEPEEGERVIKRFLEKNLNFKLDNSSYFIEQELDNKSGLLILPPIHKIEGFFISRMIRT